MWTFCENKRCSDSNPWPIDPIASVLPTTPQRLTRGQGRSPTVEHHARDWEHTFTRNRGFVSCQVCLRQGGWISESTVFPVYEGIRSVFFGCFLADWKVLCHHCYHTSGWIFIFKLVQDAKTLWLRLRIHGWTAGLHILNSKCISVPSNRHTWLSQMRHVWNNLTAVSVTQRVLFHMKSREIHHCNSLSLL